MLSKQFTAPDLAAGDSLPSDLAAILEIPEVQAAAILAKACAPPA